MSADGFAAGLPAVSLVVVAFNMQRELPRTLASLSRRMQQAVEDIAYEIIVVDNGSDPPVPDQADPAISVLRMADATPSPARAINRGIAGCRGELIGVFIDGARLASPGIIHLAALSAKTHPRPVIATLAFHLGPGVQTRTIAQGYDQAVEDGLLATSGWEGDGYRLFPISAFAGSSSGGWFRSITESNALFLPRALWQELGGYDERFVSPGGGLVNLDVYARACSLPGIQVIILLGEGTFHQLHGGISTNAAVSPWDAFHEEYVAIRGAPFQAPETSPLYVGRVHPVTLPTFGHSALKALDADDRPNRVAAPARPARSRPPDAGEPSPTKGPEDATIERSRLWPRLPPHDRVLHSRQLRGAAQRLARATLRGWEVLEERYPSTSGLTARVRASRLWGWVRGVDPNPLFDRDWYLATYPDVRASGADPYRHYLRHGVHEGRDPSAFFDTSWYLRLNADVRASGQDPLDHYLLLGAAQARDSSPWFSSAWYLQQYPDVQAAGMNPLLHYIRHGAAEGRAPRPHSAEEWVHRTRLDLPPIVPAAAPPTEPGTAARRSG